MIRAGFEAGQSTRQSEGFVKMLWQKITIPSDLGFQPQALSVKLGTLANPFRRCSEEHRRAKLLRASATTLKFRAYVNAPCEASTAART